MTAQNKYKRTNNHSISRIFFSKKAVICLTVFCVIYLSNKPNLSTNKYGKHDKDKKYILLWMPRSDPFIPFQGFTYGDDAFVKQKCKYKNCYITSDRLMLNGVEKFDAILFDGRLILVLQRQDLPQVRRPEQIYVFVTLESCDRYPVCDKVFDHYFNWTMTYRLRSDIPWPYFRIMNNKNETIGPKIEMEWQQNLAPISEKIKKNIDSKTELVAWFESKCNEDGNKRDILVYKLNEAFEKLTGKNETIDIYGTCGKFECPKNESAYCHELVQNNYFYYMALENSFDEDYVTEKLLTAVKYYTVPVVYGGANYTRFLPPHSYIDARELSPDKLAATMLAAVRNQIRYLDFFKWTNLYHYDNTNMNFACRFCEKLNENKRHNIYKNFRYWWNKDFVRKCKEMEFKAKRN